jgi:hypothetical protein
MRRGGALVLLATAALGLLALLAEAAGDQRDLAFTIGVVPSIPAATVKPGSTVCQSGISVPQPFTRVRLRAGSPGGPGPPLLLTVTEVGSNRVLGRGKLPGGYADSTEASARVGTVDAGKRIAVCVQNGGSRRVQIYGNAGQAAVLSQAVQDGKPLPNDLTLVFLRDDRRSMLAALSDAFDRASLFRPAWVGPWTFWLLSALALIGVPLLLARALADSSDAPAAPPAGPAPPE